MFDGHFRANAERTLQPVGQQIKRTGITADQLTATGVVMAIGASVAIANGALRAGLVLLILTAVPDLLDGAVAKASGTASPRGAFFDSVADRFTDAMLLGGVAGDLSTTHPRRIAVLAPAAVGGSPLLSYERPEAASLGHHAHGDPLGRPGAPSLQGGPGRRRTHQAPRRTHGARGAHERARPGPALLPTAGAGAVGDVGPLLDRRRPGVREGVEAGERRGGGQARAPGAC